MKDFWNERFEGPDYFYGTSPNHFLTTVSHLLKAHSNILCIGEGEGRNAVYLATLGHSVTGVDLSEQGKLKTEALAQKKHVSVKYCVTPLEDFDFGEQEWDAVVSIFCHLPPMIREKIYPKINKALRDDGLLILQAYTPKQLEFGTGGPKDVSMLYTETLLKTDFPHMEWIKMTDSIEEIREGIGHTGKSSVLSAVGKNVLR